MIALLRSELAAVSAAATALLARLDELPIDCGPDAHDGSGKCCFATGGERAEREALRRALGEAVLWRHADHDQAVGRTDRKPR